MVNSLLFRWEDTPALKHHCGFCDRPLSHPGARVSCFGTHAEPCHRFHQAMFMRGRGHICHYCHTIDEAHYTRHHNIAEQLHSIYESCGEGDWPIVPSDSVDCERGREVDTRLANSRESNHGLALDDTLSSKRDKKDAKRLARAASRSRVITQEEIRYIDSVLHFAEGVFGSENDGPRNTDEIDEIEKHLRFNAHVYHNSNRRELKKFAQIPEADVDFDGEMERILDSFRISELVKRNTRTKGLQGKDLKVFQTLVFEFKRAVIDDLVLAKKDFLEVRMRRAGYLRYTHKTAYGIVEDRYSDRDWKTGERIQTSSSSESSGVTTPAELSVEGDISMLSDALQEYSPPKLRSSTQTPDRRHLEKIHRRVNGDDGVHTTIIEPYDAPLLSISPVSTSRKHPVQLKVVVTKSPEANSRKLGHESALQTLGTQQHISSWSTIPKPLRGGKPQYKGFETYQRDLTNRSTIHPTEEYPSLSQSKLVKLKSSKASAPAVQAPPASTSGFSDKPEGFKTLFDESIGHHVISQKKAKKSQHGMKRKAKKITSQEGTPSLEQGDSKNTKDDINNPSSNSSSPIDILSGDVNFTGQTVVAKSTPPAREKTVHSHTTNLNDGAEETPDNFAISMPPAPLTISVTQNSKHAHWVKFTRYFMLDQLTIPCLQAYSGCIHGTTCQYEANNIPNCPYHKPHCACVDPLADQCYLVYPGSSADMCSSGPYNRLRGRKLQALYEKDPIFKGRIMLVDEDMAMWLLSDLPNRDSRNPSSVFNRLIDMPQRLSLEYADFQGGYNPGPLMEQERIFERIRQKNKVMKQQITRNMLLNFQRKNNDREGITYMCYCHDEAPEHLAMKDVVTCSHRDCKVSYFHKSCVMKLGVDKVSCWYCTACEHRMGAAVRQFLRDMGCTDIPDEEEDLNDFDADLVSKFLKAPVGAMSKLKSRIRKLDAPEMEPGTMGLESGDAD